MIEFGVENFMRVKTVIVRPSGPVVELSGRNKQGKTSVLRALVSVFAGRDSLPGKPIRKGETESRVWTVLGRDKAPELTIEEVLTLKEGDEPVGRKLIVTPADGRKFPTPQAVLDRLYDPIAFAPFEFVRKKPAEQLEIVKGLVAGFDFEATAAARKAAFDERTITGRDRERALALYNSIIVPAGTPEKPVDVSALAVELRDAMRANAEVQERQRRRDDAAAQIEAKRDEAERTRARAATLDTEADTLEARLSEAEPLPIPQEVGPIEERMHNAEAINAGVRKLQDREAARLAHRTAEAEYVRLTEKIEGLDETKADAIAGANLPIPGLELTEDGLLLNGLPLDQASGREKVEVGVRIGLAINPELKLIIVEEGALLDDDGMEMLESLAGKFGFLVVIERVTNGEKVGITIEDGEVAP